MLEPLFNKISRNKETPTRVFSCEFCEAFKSTLFKSTSGGVGVCLKKFYILGVLKKVFVWLAANEFLSNSKNYIRVYCIPITNEVFEHLSVKKDSFNQIIRKWQPKGVFIDFFEKYLGMNGGV